MTDKRSVPQAARKVRHEGLKFLDEFMRVLPNVRPMQNPSYDSAPRQYMRDTQTSRVYGSERELRRWLEVQNPPVEARFPDIPSAQRYVDDVLARPWPEYHGVSGSKVTVVGRHSVGTAHYWSSRIELPVVGHDVDDRRWALREIVLLHEIAHHFVGVEQGHNANWVMAMLLLTSQHMGMDIAKRLFRIYSEKGVAFQ